jgi:hypothetical protein
MQPEKAVYLAGAQAWPILRFARRASAAVSSATWKWHRSARVDALLQGMSPEIQVVLLRVYRMFTNHSHSLRDDL